MEKKEKEQNIRNKKLEWHEIAPTDTKMNTNNILRYTNYTVT
jgi:hypothetical protein